MSIVMQLQDVAESTRLGPLSGEVRAGEILHLVGPNGAGKSTLLARMAGMTSGKGSIQFAGQPLEAWSATKLALHRAYLSQQQTPPFAMPVWHYLTLHQHDKTRTELLNDVAGALALDDKLGRSTNQLSGGEWQRVRLAAVVLQITPQANPAGQLLLLDEPMNSLDVAQQSALDKILSALCQQGLAIVMSSHDPNHTLRIAHRAGWLKGGKMWAGGRREGVPTPQNWARALGGPLNPPAPAPPPPRGPGGG
ncbi:vitamin B12 ABC transporter ATP-binding protein BtuD, partial [Escherichia coli]|nr:vitamin B12 ABC transporter ATP-binding protein BtuD [Escherichia coli]